MTAERIAEIEEKIQNLSKEKEDFLDHLNATRDIVRRNGFQSHIEYLEVQIADLEANRQTLSSSENADA